MGDAPLKVVNDLKKMQKEMLERARAIREQNTFEITKYEDLKAKIDGGGFFLAPWSPDRDNEAKVKEETKATIRCYLLDENFQPKKTDKPCMMTGKTGPGNVLAIFARAY